MKALAWYRFVYVVCIVALSVQTALGAQGMSDHHFWLAIVEIGGALLMLLRRTQIVGLVVLLTVYLAASIVTWLSGHLPMHLVIYAASALLIVQLDRTSASTHGPSAA